MTVIAVGRRTGHQQTNQRITTNLYCFQYSLWWFEQDTIVAIYEYQIIIESS